MRFVKYSELIVSSDPQVGIEQLNKVLFSVQEKGYNVVDIKFISSNDVGRVYGIMLQTPGVDNE